MHKLNLSVSGLSTSLAMGLALWEVYFFFLAGNTGRLDGTLGIFTPDRLGFNMAWLVLIYLSYQLISIPFSLPTAAVSRSHPEPAASIDGAVSRAALLKVQPGAAVFSNVCCSLNCALAGAA